jgi:hypothetical protein
MAGLKRLNREVMCYIRLLLQPPSAVPAHRIQGFLELIWRMPRIETSLADVLLTPFAGVIFPSSDQVVGPITFLSQMDNILCHLNLLPAWQSNISVFAFGHYSGSNMLITDSKLGSVVREAAP